MAVAVAAVALAVLSGGAFAKGSPPVSRSGMPVSGVLVGDSITGRSIIVREASGRQVVVHLSIGTEVVGSANGTVGSLMNAMARHAIHVTAFFNKGLVIHWPFAGTSRETASRVVVTVSGRVLPVQHVGSSRPRHGVSGNSGGR